MLDIFIDIDFSGSIPAEAKTKQGIRTPLDKLLKLCEDIGASDFQLRASRPITKKDIENDPILEYFVEHCKKYSDEIILGPVDNLNSQLAFLSSTSNLPWLEQGYDVISVNNFVKNVDSVTYEFDIDLSKNTPYDEIKPLISKIAQNFNFIVVEDYYLGKELRPFLFEEYLKTITSSFSSNSLIEIVIITDFNETNVNKIFESYSKLVSKYIQESKLLIIKAPTDNSIHDRRIWTNSRQFYSGMGFSGKDSKGFLKPTHFSKSIFSKNPKIQFKNQYMHNKGIASRVKLVSDVKEIIRKAENSSDGKTINFFPLDQDGSKDVKNFVFLNRM